MDLILNFNFNLNFKDFLQIFYRFFSDFLQIYYSFFTVVLHIFAKKGKSNIIFASHQTSFKHHVSREEKKGVFKTSVKIFFFPQAPSRKWNFTSFGQKFL